MWPTQARFWLESATRFPRVCRFGLASMRSSKSNSLLPGVLIVATVFAALWFLFSAVIRLGLMFAGIGNFFRPQWYETAIPILGGSALAYLSVKQLLRYIWPKSYKSADDFVQR